MSIINCPECKNEISDKAIACPNCGCPIAPPLMKNSPISKAIKNTRNIKIIIACLVAVFSVVVIYIIANGKPSGMSDEVYRNGKDAISIIDKYMDYEMDSEKAVLRLEDIKNTLDRIYDNTGETDAFLLSAYIFSTKINVKWKFESPIYTAEDLLKHRNDIAKVINVKARK